jgi:hypothetical protein
MSRPTPKTTASSRVMSSDLELSRARYGKTTGSAPIRSNGLL